MKQDSENLEVASGSPLPGVKVIMILSVMFFVLENLKFCLFFIILTTTIFFFYSVFLFYQPQVLDESIRIPKETIDILKDQVFGFDTFFVTNQEPYEVS